MPIKEHAFDDYVRKYHGTITVIEQDGEKKQLLVVEFVNSPGSITAVTSNGTIVHPFIPIYYHFKAGYYRTSGGKWVLLVRKNTKSFKVGLCNENYYKYHLTEEGLALDSGFPSSTFCNFLELPEITPAIKLQSFKNSGPLTSKIGISEEALYYLNQKIGFRTGNRKVFVVPNESLHQDVRDALSGLELHGIECKITS
jgi:hypothetical protein